MQRTIRLTLSLLAIVAILAFTFSDIKNDKKSINVKSDYSYLKFRSIPVKDNMLLETMQSSKIHTETDLPNVLFIAIDDLNDMVGFLNNHPGVRTPYLDKLAANGISFTHAYCAAPSCNPSRTAVLTGLSPTHTGIYKNNDDWRIIESTKNAVTLPECFQAAGYLTKGGGKIYHAWSFNENALTGFMDPRPWDEYFPSKMAQMPEEVEPEKWPVNSTREFYNGHFDWAPLNINDNEMADGKVVSWAEKQLSIKHEKPLFLAVGIYRPHVPWWTPKEYFDLHPLDKIILPEVDANDLEDLPDAAKKFIRIRWHEWITENRQWEKAVQGYLASMTFADAMVGRLINALEKGPMADNMVIVLWSDHGYHLGQKKHWSKFALWEQTTHVPLLFIDSRPEGSRLWTGGSRCTQPASLLDIYPTLAEICSLDYPKNLDGVSLLPLLQNPAMKTRKAVVTTWLAGNNSVRSENWRYTRYADGSEELYNDKTDPWEYKNLASNEKYVTIKKKLAGWLP